MSSPLPSYAHGIVYLYDRNRLLNDQLKLCFSKTSYEQDPPLIQHFFYPLMTQAGLVSIYLNEDFSQKPSICEFIILENDRKHTVPTKRLDRSRVSTRPLEQKIIEIEDTASQALKNMGDLSRRLDEQMLRFRVQRRPSSCVLL